MSNPVDKYLSEKTAGIGDMLGRAKEPMMNAALGAGTAAAVGAGAAAVSFGAHKLYDAITKRRDFRLMLEHNPDLVSEQEKNPRLFNQAYSSLRAMNPQFGQDPLIAGRYMREIMDEPLFAGGKLREAATAGNQKNSPILEATVKGLFEGAKSGLNRPVDPHAGLRSQVEGMRLNRQAVDLQSAQYSPISKSPWAGGGESG